MDAAWRRLVLGMVVALCMPMAVVRAQQRHPLHEMSAGELDARIHVIGAYLDAIEEPSRRHYASWVTLLSVAGVTQIVLAAVADSPRNLTNSVVGATLSVAGLVSVVATPHPARKAFDRFRKMPQRTLQERRDKLAQGEAWLAAEANEVRWLRSWVPQVGAVVIGLGAGLALGFAYENNWAAGLREGLGALVITEVRVWSRPKAVLKYEQRYLEYPTIPVFSLQPWFRPQAVGMALQGTF